MSNLRTPSLDIPHVWDLGSAAGLVDLLTAAFFAELQNLLSPESYQETDDPDLMQSLSSQGHIPSFALEHNDISAVSHDLRTQNVLARGRMLELLHFTSAHYHVFDGAGDELDLWKDLFFPGLAWLIYSVDAYYHRSQAADKTNIRPLLFQRQVDSVLRSWEMVSVALNNPVTLVNRDILTTLYAAHQTEKPSSKYFLPTCCRSSSLVVQRRTSPLACESVDLVSWMSVLT